MKKLKRNLTKPFYMEPRPTLEQAGDCTGNDPGTAGACMFCDEPMTLTPTTPSAHVCRDRIRKESEERNLYPLPNNGQRMNQEFSPEEIENSEKEFQAFLEKRKAGIERNIGVDVPRERETHE